MPMRTPISDADAQRVLRITLLCKVVQDSALRAYSEGNYAEIKAALLTSYTRLAELPTFKSQGECAPPCVPCGDVCVCPQEV